MSEKILVVDDLQRVADHATNIAERVIYMVTGRSVAHAGKQLPPDAGPS